MAKQFEDLINEKLDRMLRLLGMFAVKGLSQREQISALSRAGFAPKDIAELLGTTANTVRVALVSIRKTERFGRGRAGTSRKERADEQG